MQHMPQIVRVGPFNRLLREKVVRNGLNVRVRRSSRNLVGEILDDHAAPEVRTLGAHVVQNKAAAGANVDEEDLGDGRGWEERGDGGDHTVAAEGRAGSHGGREGD